MSKRQKCTYEDRVQAVEDYLSGRKNQKQIAADLGLGKRGRSTVGLWVRKYQEAGPESLRSSVRNRVYSKGFKEQVVREYLDGKGSMEALAIKYGIPNHGSVQEWISMYNSHRELEATPVAEEVPMGASKRNICLGERIEIVQYCIGHELNYAKTARDFDVPYWQVYNWVKKYKEGGEEGLIDRRGRKRPEDELGETERLQRRIKQLERELEEERLKNELLKKVQEVERRRCSPKES